MTDQGQAVLDELFPARRDIRAPVSSWSHDVPWLTIDGGLKQWRTTIRYERDNCAVIVRVTYTVPLVGIIDREGTVGVSRRFFARDFEHGVEHGMQRVMDFVREALLHEVLEGLRVDGKPYFSAEVDHLHGDPRAGR